MPIGPCLHVRHFMTQRTLRQVKAKVVASGIFPNGAFKWLQDGVLVADGIGFTR